MFCDYGSYIRNNRAQDYHDRIGKLFQEMKDIVDNSGIILTLDFGSGRKHDVITIPVIKFFIGDCKGNNMMCGRKGGHFNIMIGLCRDCNMKPSDGNNACIE